VQKNNWIDAGCFHPAVAEGQTHNDGKTDLEQDKTGWVMAQVIQVSAGKDQGSQYNGQCFRSPSGVYFPETPE
jgi:hypothetical protein